jgi:hypothetical protein
MPDRRLPFTHPEPNILPVEPLRAAQAARQAEHDIEVVQEAQELREMLDGCVALDALRAADAPTGLPPPDSAEEPASTVAAPKPSRWSGTLA